MGDKRTSISAADSIARVIMQEQDAANALRVENKILQQRIAELEQREAESIKQQQAWAVTVKRLRQGNQELAATVEYLKTELKTPIEAEFNDDCQCNFICQYCGEELGSKYAARDEHLESCKLIPANRLPATNLTAVKRSAILELSEWMLTSKTIPFLVGANDVEGYANQRYPDKE